MRKREQIQEGDRRSEKDLWEEFEIAHPRILGVLLDAVARGLAMLPHTRLEKLPRMADFALWATACETQFWPKGTFWAAYCGNRDNAVEGVLESDLVAVALRAFIEERVQWNGTATELLGALCAQVGEKQTRFKDWPQSARALSGRLRRAATFLRKVGVEIDFRKVGVRTIHISLPAENGGTQPSVPSAPSSSAPNFNGGNGFSAHPMREKGGAKTINDEVQLLLRLCGEQGVLIRATLRRDKALKLPLPPSPGRPYSTDEKARMLEEAQKLRTPQMRAALALDLNTGLRDKELREIRWEQVDLIHKKSVTVGKSKTDAGTGRVVPLNETALAALEAHAAWYTRRFGECKPDWFVFAFGTPLPRDPTLPITSFKTAWTKVRKNPGVKGRWHDNRHTLITELAESGAGDEVIMSIAGHVSHAMLSRYSHVRMEAKRRALDEIAARQRAADEKRKQELERQQAVLVSQSLVIQ